MPKPNIQSETVLRAMAKREEANLHQLNDELKFDTRSTLNSLTRCGFIAVVRTMVRTMRDMNVYAITIRGTEKICEIDNNPQQRPQPEPKPVKKAAAPMRAVPDKHASVNVMTAVMGGREIKITYGTQVPYEVYRPAPDHSRNYTPRPIRGILA